MQIIIYWIYYIPNILMINAYLSKYDNIIIIIIYWLLLLLFHVCTYFNVKRRNMKKKTRKYK